MAEHHGGENINSMLPGSLYSNAADREKFSENVMRDFKEKMEDKTQLQMISFPSCVINKPSSQKFILRNLSGIKTTFNFLAITYEPPPPLNQKTAIGNIESTATKELESLDTGRSDSMSKPGSK
jgi:methyltransferase-like protein